MEHTYHIYFNTNACGLHSLIHDVEFTGTKTAAIRFARETKKNLVGMGITKLPVHYEIYDFDLEEYI